MRIWKNRVNYFVTIVIRKHLCTMKICFWLNDYTVVQHSVFDVCMLQSMQYRLFIQFLPFLWKMIFHILQYGYSRTKHGIHRPWLAHKYCRSYLHVACTCIRNSNMKVTETKSSPIMNMDDNEKQETGASTSASFG